MTLLLLVSASVSANASEFRTFDGVGNNLYEPSFGAANSRVTRVGYDADYPDGIGDEMTYPGKPNPRDVSQVVHAQSESIINSRGLSDWIVQWGQFVTHDLSLIPTGPAGDLLSTGTSGDFRIPVNDSTDVLGPGPIPFERSIYDPTSGNGDVVNTPRGPQPIPRWQVNSATSYLDASHVYGSDDVTATSLRTFVDGKLLASAGGLLPPVDSDGNFFAGDPRVNENTALTATHALFLQEHNRLAGRIQAYDNSLTDEAIYQWARKIVGAQMQIITYGEFLPALIGNAAPQASDYFYDDGLNASITTAFSTAAFRYGHSMQSSQIMLVDEAGVEVGTLPLSDSMHGTSILHVAPEKLPQILRGLATQAAQENDVYVVDELRNMLFGLPGAGGIDLAALDIQRGRDHGLVNSYSVLRTSYSLPPVTQFSELTSDPVVQAALESVYGTVDNLDAWVAIIAEDHVAESSLGSLAQTIIVSQFERLRDGDRFFYYGDPDLQSDLVKSVVDLDSITLSQIIEFNTGWENLPANVFFATTAIPEPSTAMLLLLASASIAMARTWSLKRPGRND